MQRIEYDWKPVKCGCCGVLGHESGKCKLKKEPNVEVKEKKTQEIESKKNFETVESVSKLVENTKLLGPNSSLGYLVRCKDEF